MSAPKRRRQPFIDLNVQPRTGYDMTPDEASAYLDAVAAALSLPVPPERRDAVIAQLVRLSTLAEDVLAWQPPLAPEEHREDA